MEWFAGSAVTRYPPGTPNASPAFTEITSAPGRSIAFAQLSWAYTRLGDSARSAPGSKWSAWLWVNSTSVTDSGRSISPNVVAVRSISSESSIRVAVSRRYSPRASGPSQSAAPVPRNCSLILHPPLAVVLASL